MKKCAHFYTCNCLHLGFTYSCTRSSVWLCSFNEILSDWCYCCKWWPHSLSFDHCFVLAQNGRTQKYKKKKSEKEIKLNIKRLLLLSQWVLLVHEGPSGARIPAEMRPRGWCRGRESFSWTWTLFSQQPESSILCLAVFIPLAVNGIFAFIILSSSAKEHKKAEWESEREPVISQPTWH